jgi:carbon monoxide dehydrogenase subunit G
MELENRFTVPVGVEEAWKVLLDVERIAPCMPGAVLETVDEEGFTGRVKVRLGPMSLTYRGKASFTEKDEGAHRAVIAASGREAKGAGTAKATITAALEEHGSETLVRVRTDLAITGRPAQFGRGILEEVASSLIGQFADALAAEVSASPQSTPASGEGGPVDAGPAAHAPAATAGPAEVNLVKAAAWPVARRALPPLAAMLLVLGWMAHRRNRRPERTA